MDFPNLQLKDLSNDRHDNYCDFVIIEFIFVHSSFSGIYFDVIRVHALDGICRAARARRDS